VEAEAKAEKEASELRVQLAAAQASHESAQQKVKRLEQDVERLEQQLVGSQAAVAPKEEQQLVAQVQSHSVYMCLSCTSLYALSRIRLPGQCWKLSFRQRRQCDEQASASVTTG